MTPTPSPEVIQQAAESAGLFAGLEPAVIAALITGSAAILVALLGGFLSGVIAFLTLNRSNKFERERLKDLIKNERERHEDEMAERRADRLYETRLQTATDTYNLYSQFRFPLDKKTIRDDITKLDWHTLSAKFTLLFPSLAINIEKLSSSASKLLKIENQVSQVESTNTTELDALGREHETEAIIYRTELARFAQALRKELGTYKEPQKKKDS